MPDEIRTTDDQGASQSGARITTSSEPGASTPASSATGNTGTTPASLLPTGDPSDAIPGVTPIRDGTTRNVVVDNTPDPFAEGKGTGTTSAEPGSTDRLTPAVPAPGEHGETHVMVKREDVGFLRRLFSDLERGVDGAEDRLKDAFHRLF